MKAAAAVVVAGGIASSVAARAALADDGWDLEFDPTERA